MGNVGQYEFTGRNRDRQIKVRQHFMKSLTIGLSCVDRDADNLVNIRAITAISGWIRVILFTSR